ncbi:MAG: hypothetical protein QXD23_02155 [Candidatus Micrarchaeaceae archaeon]
MVKHDEFIDKNRAFTSTNIKTLKSLSNHKSEFVRLAIVLNRKIVDSKKIIQYEDLLVKMAKNDPMPLIRDLAITKLLQLKRD